MKKLLAVVVLCIGAMALAQDGGPSMQGADAGTHGGAALAPMWVPSNVTHEDRKGIDALWKAWGQAFMNQNFDAAADRVDFPVLMVTDDGKGHVTTAEWDRDTWIRNMKRAMQAMPHPKGGKMPIPKHSYDFLTNDIVVATSTSAMAMGKKSVTVKSSSLLVRKDGKWMIKSMAEGGWGASMSEGGAK